MISKLALEHAAIHDGIFATATPFGDTGHVLLASLGVDLNSEQDCKQLLALIARGEVTPVMRAESPLAVEQRIQAELVGRGIPAWAALRLTRLSWLGDTSHVPARWYYALAMPARVATASTLRDYPIKCMRTWLGDRTDDVAMRLREACAVALGERATAHGSEVQGAREICAEEWNRFAGVTWGTQHARPTETGEDRPYMILRPSGECFMRFKNDCREEALVEACEVIEGQRCEPAAAWIGNRLTIHCDDGDWALVELDG